MRKIFEGEMLFRTLPTTLLQVFCKIIYDFQVSVKVSEIQTTISTISLKH